MNARNIPGMHRALRILCVAVVTVVVACVQAQVAFPDQYIQDVAWTEGMHHYTLAQPIIAPGNAAEPIFILGTADAEFVSGTSVHLTDGFHAGGFTGEGRFHAYIDEAIDGADAVAIITPAPDQIVDGVLHVKKWEKLEIGLELPPKYLAAIDSFFAHYYPFDPYPYDPTMENDNRPVPGNVDAMHDLNPYADDSLQVYMVLSDPDNDQRMKWAFHMREVKWGPQGDTALPMDAPDHLMDRYRMRFRFAPDKEGSWQFRIGIRAPHTLDGNDVPLPELNYIPYYFYCDPPPEGNHGPLHVNTTNNKILQHADGTAYFGMGVNMADVIHYRGPTPFGDPSKLYQRDMNVMKQSMDQLHEVGGNFLRMMMGQHHFAPEAFNLGVYDRYRGIFVCNVGEYSNHRGDCQHQAWSFDQILDHAQEKDIYIQLCVEPSPPTFGTDAGWGASPYVTNFLNNVRDTADSTYSLKKYFYANGDPATRDSLGSIFYYWKRKYKYIMDRWGYSPHLAIIEPFNEIDNLLGYFREYDHRGNTNVCPWSRAVWPVQDSIPETLDSWLTDITDYVRGNVDPHDPVASPLGENKLFLMSYAYNDPDRTDRDTFYMPFYNDKVDLMDAHMYLRPDSGEVNQPDTWLKWDMDHTHGFLDRTPSAHFPAKPFNTGEFDYTTHFNGFGLEIEKIFHNYDVSFHNEIWASAFSGKWATGTTWQWERVFWWPDALPAPPPDLNNAFQQANFSNVLGESITLDIGIDGDNNAKEVVNRRLHHHFKPLADLLAHPSWQVYDFFNGDYTPNKVFDVSEDLEAYYLKDISNTLAIGWVHNRNAWGMNNYYLKYLQKNFLGCDQPNSDIITLTGFQPLTPFTITWFSTQTNSTAYPPQADTTSNSSGELVLDLTGHFGGVADNYLDTLRSDYAFIVTTAPFTKSREPNVSLQPPIEDVWDFAMYPNPTRDEVYLKVHGNHPKEIILQDLSGRQLQTLGSTTEPIVRLATSDLAKGVYIIRVSDGTHSRTKKLIVH